MKGTKENRREENARVNDNDNSKVKGKDKDSGHANDASSVVEE